MTQIAPGIVCQTPCGPVVLFASSHFGWLLVGADAFRGFLGPFSRILTRSELIAAFGDGRTAVLIYDTVAVQNAPAAEYLTVTNGKITRMRILFDRAPFDAARRATETDR